MPPAKTTRQKQKVALAKELQECVKCGSVMIRRKITKINGSKNGTAKLVTVLQCIVCRHWTSLE